MPEEHALLSASSSERWLRCTPSARLEEGLPESTSCYAEEGRLAHALGELKLRKHFLEPMGERTYKSRLKKLQADPLYDPEMDSCTDEYLEYIKAAAMTYQSRPFVAVESRLDFSAFVPEGFGTGDCIVVGGDLLQIIDLKYGKGVPVEAEGNPQMRLYAVGAVLAYGMLYDIKRVKMTIFQPRLGSVSEAEMSREDLFNWAAFEVKPKAAAAFAGEGTPVAGEWCRWCRAKAPCSARSGTHLALEDFKGAMPPLLTDAEIGEVLIRAQTLQRWVSDLEDYALSAVLAGKEIPGWKAVEGRSNRRFADTDRAFESVMNAGYSREMLYDEVPKTLTALEKLLGKSVFDGLLSGYIEKPQGKPALAPEKDKRPPFVQSAALADFAGITESK